MAGSEQTRTITSENNLKIHILMTEICIPDFYEPNRINSKLFHKSYQIKMEMKVLSKLLYTFLTCYFKTIYMTRLLNSKQIITNKPKVWIT